MTALYIGGAGQGKYALARRIHGAEAPLVDALHERVRDILAQGGEPMELLPTLQDQIVLCDEVGAAGSFDRLLWSQASNLYAIGDIKTGSSPDPAYALRYSGLSWAIQLAIYAHGTPWPGGWDAIPADPPRLDIGVVLYVPRGSGVCHPITVDLAKGWRAAQLAAQVRTIRKESVAV